MNNENTPVISVEDLWGDDEVETQVPAPEATEVSIEATPDTEEGADVFDHVIDIPRGVVDGALNAVDEIAETADHLMPLGAIGEDGYTPPPKDTWTRNIMDGIGLTDADEEGAYVNDIEGVDFGDLVDDPTTMTGNVAKGFSQFMVSMVPAVVARTVDLSRTDFAMTCRSFTESPFCTTASNPGGREWGIALPFSPVT